MSDTKQEAVGLDAKLLNLGDWVIYENNAMGTKNPLQLYDIVKMTLACHFNDLKPLPLTREMLLYNGFDKDEDEERYTKQFGLEGVITVTFKNSSPMFKSTVPDSKYVVLNIMSAVPELFAANTLTFFYKGDMFVHQMQHAMRDVGMVDEANSFEVKLNDN